MVPLHPPERVRGNVSGISGQQPGNPSDRNCEIWTKGFPFKSMTSTEVQAVELMRSALAFAMDEVLADLRCERNHLRRMLALTPMPPLETDVVRLVDHWRSHDPL